MDLGGNSHWVPLANAVKGLEISLVTVIIVNVHFFHQTSDFEDVVYSSKLFDKVVETYPDTIKCHSQNKPITEAFRPHSDALDTPEEPIHEGLFVTLSSGYKSKEVLYNLYAFCEDFYFLAEYLSLWTVEHVQFLL